jgi:hypothetical protein
MKNIQIPSFETYSKVLVALGMAGIFAIAGVFVGCLMPWPLNEIHYAPLIFAAISVGLASLVWSLFRLIEPVHYDRAWTVAEITLVPLYWLLLLLAVNVSLGWLIQRSIEEMKDVVPSIL